MAERYAFRILLSSLLLAAAALAQNRSTPLVVLPAADDALSGQIRLREKYANGSNYAGFKAPAALAGDRVWELPGADGTAAQCLKTDGAFVLTFGACATMVYPGAGVAVSTGSAWGSSLTVGTAASNLVQLDGSAKLPAVDGSQLTNIPSGAFAAPVISTSGPVTVAATSGRYYNNASGALTYNLPAITAGMVTASAQFCFSEYVGKSGAITLQAPASTYIFVLGVNGTVAGTLVSSGVLGDSACVAVVDTTHYEAALGPGVWVNN
jgi:hypothetical protein